MFLHKTMEKVLTFAFRSRASLVLALLLALPLAGCTSFNRDWKAAAKSAPFPNAIEGRWEGTWLSHTNGHHGRLRCLMTRNSDEQFLARFHATYKKILRFGYTVPLTVHRTNGVYEFQGGADLGKLAG